jgi:hypothetical protein
MFKKMFKKIFKKKKLPSEERHFVRHPTNIPIEIIQTTNSVQTTNFVQTTNSVTNKEYLNNVSLGGLAFQSDILLEKGSLITIRVLVDSPIELTGKVTWCKQCEKHFDIGVKFTGDNKLLRDDMVEEVCQIEMYRKMINTLVADVLYEQWEEYVP